MSILWRIKHELNNPLDQMISATMILDGAPGTKFDVTNTTTRETLSVILASGESKAKIPVPLGTYAIKVIYDGKSVTVCNLNVRAFHSEYRVPYTIKTSIFESGTLYVVPDDILEIFIERDTEYRSAGGGG